MAATPARTMTAAGDRAKSKVGTANQIGYCLRECVVNIYGIPGPWGWGGNGEAWAINFWFNAVSHGKVVKTTDPAKVPYGAMLFFDSPLNRAEHVAIGAGNGYCFSTDYPVRGKWGKAKITDIGNAWGMHLVGYILTTGDGVVLTDPPATVDPMDPKAYYLGAHGDYVTKLGELLVAKGFGRYTQGPGPTYGEADVASVKALQAAMGFTGDDADGFPGLTSLTWLYGPETEIVRQTELPSAPEAPVEEEPTVPTTVTIPLMLMPCAGYNASDKPGVTRWAANVKGLLGLVTQEKPTILGVTEMSAKSIDPMRQAFDAGATAYTRRGGSDGRFVYLRDSHVTRHIADGVFNVPRASTYNGDDKQAAWSVDELEPGVIVAVGCGHTENENGIDKTTGKDADDLRVEQALSFESQLRAKAKEHGAKHVVLMGDFNSRSAVRDALVKRGWKACLTPGSATGWDHVGGSVADWIFVLDGELTSRVHSNPYSDHTYVTASWTVTV